MTVAALTVIYDASVLYPAPLRDLLIHLAAGGLVRARWTREIHEEWIGALLARRVDLARGRLERTRELMNAAVLDCLVEGYEALIPSLVLPDRDDRHVLAAAIRCRADRIVTGNTRDFPAQALAPYDIIAQHPDAFVRDLIEGEPGRVCALVRLHRTSLRNPAKTVEEYLETLARQALTESVRALRSYAPDL